MKFGIESSKYVHDRIQYVTMVPLFLLQSVVCRFMDNSGQTRSFLLEKMNT